MKKIYLLFFAVFPLNSMNKEKAPKQHTRDKIERIIYSSKDNTVKRTRLITNIAECLEILVQQGKHYPYNMDQKKIHRVANNIKNDDLLLCELVKLKMEEHHNMSALERILCKPCKSIFIKLVSCLLKAGASTTDYNNQGLTASDIAHHKLIEETNLKYRKNIKVIIVKLNKYSNLNS